MATMVSTNMSDRMRPGFVRAQLGRSCWMMYPLCAILATSISRAASASTESRIITARRSIISLQRIEEMTAPPALLLLCTSWEASTKTVWVLTWIWIRLLPYTGVQLRLARTSWESFIRMLSPQSIVLAKQVFVSWLCPAAAMREVLDFVLRCLSGKNRKPKRGKENFISAVVHMDEKPHICISALCPSQRTGVSVPRRS